MWRKSVNNDVIGYSRARLFSRGARAIKAFHRLQNVAFRNAKRANVQAGCTDLLKKKTEEKPEYSVGLINAIHTAPAGDDNVQRQRGGDGGGDGILEARYTRERKRERQREGSVEHPINYFNFP